MLQAEDYDDDDREIYDDDDDGESLGSADLLGTVLTGGMNKVVPAVARAFTPRVVRPAKGKYANRVQGTRGGTIKTPSGNAEVQLPQSVATKREVQDALASVAADLKANADAIQALDGKYDNLLRAQGSSLKKTRDSIRQQTMLSLFMQPKLTELQFEGGNAQKVAATKYEDNMLMLLLAMGGFGDSSESGNDAMMMAMAMGAFNTSSKK